MASLRRVTAKTDIVISDRIRFRHQNRWIHGFVAKTGRTNAHIVCDDGNEFQVPYSLLEVFPPSERREVMTRTDRLRLQFSPGDGVRFSMNGNTVKGTIARINPKTALVVGEDQQEFRVAYSLLTAAVDTENRGKLRAERLDKIREMAALLLQDHNLQHWRFTFDHGSRRAGCCNFTQKEISLSESFSLFVEEDEIREALLHEIAHALVGAGHNHDGVWKAKAREIGCSGERCHDITFAPPRYIMHCENNCWLGVAERRKHQRVCGKCRGRLIFLTYTPERWQQMQTERKKRCKSPT